jgi:putative nucleotidyltransferase with HDIG domain
MGALAGTKDAEKTGPGAECKRPWALSAPPPFPAIAIRVIQILARVDCEVKQAVGCIQSDPVFAAEVLRVANSALYGFSHEIKSVQHASVTLGPDFVKALAVTVGMRAYVKSAMKIPVLRRCWRHSMACALLAQDLASACWMKADEAYTAGLLHDIGRMGLIVAHPVEYANVLNVSAEHSIEVQHCEREVFDLDHSQAGAWLAVEWKLPAHYSHIASHHHDEVTAGSSDLPAVVSLSCLLADSLDFGVIEGRASQTLDEIRARLPLTAQSRFKPDPEQLKKKLTARLESLNLQ